MNASILENVVMTASCQVLYPKPSQWQGKRLVQYVPMLPVFERELWNQRVFVVGSLTINDIQMADVVAVAECRRNGPYALKHWLARGSVHNVLRFNAFEAPTFKALLENVPDWINCVDAAIEVLKPLIEVETNDSHS